MTAVKAPGKLLRVLGAGFGIAVIVGAVIGVGILRTPGEVARHAGNVWLILGLWLAGGIYALVAAASVTELGTMLPQAGGYFIYSRRAFGDAVGFTVGWTDWLGQSAAIAYASIAMGEFLSALVPQLAGRESWIGISVILLFGALQWTGIRASSRVQQATSLIKALAFLALVAACFWKGGGVDLSTVAPVRTEPLLIAMVLAFSSIVLTYDGWYEALYFTEEIYDPARDLPRVMIGGVALVIVIYMLVNAALVYVLPLSELAASKLPAADAAQKLFGASSGRIIVALSLLSLPPMINAVMMCASRILYAMSRAALLPSRLGGVSDRGTPEWALLATLVMACGLAATGTFRELIAVASFIFVVNHCFAFVAMFVLRRREPGLARPFRVWGYPWATAVVLIAAVGFLGGSLVSDTKHSLYALGLIGISFPLCALLRRARLNAVN
jgi:APA family basic amino acid/polyamine antiporter